MKLVTTNSMKLLTAAFLGFSPLVPPVVGLPKTAWAQQRTKGHGRKLFGASIEKSRQHVRDGCVVKSALDIDAPRENIWAGLTEPEAVSVVEWLFAQPSLNLTTSEDAGSWDNTLLLVELMRPNKSEALSYVDDSGVLPTRYARAVISHQADENLYFQDILVGPLPVVNGTTTWAPLEYPFTRKTGGKIRNLDADSDALYGEWLHQVSSTVADITLDLWNATALGLENDTLSIWGIDPVYQEEDRILRWDTFWSNPTSMFNVESMMPMGLFLMSDVSGRDVSKWSVQGWYYNGIFYETTEEFRTAYWSGEVEKLDGNWDGPWAETDRQGPIPPLDTMAPPVATAPQGARYSVDAERKYVEWMGWSFYIGFTRDSGMALFDIRYKGQRILYELGLQEALAHYAGSDPIQSHIAYLDTYYGFGPFAFELLKGYDCPTYATYLNSSFYVSETTHTHLNSICLFEFDADHPMARHSSSEYVTAIKNVYFIVRSVSTVGNYDYMFSYSFFMDGSITVEARASGYIRAAFFAKNHDYGFRIHDQLSGSMHDHVLNYKADFDILGTDNTVQIIEQVPHTTTYPWSKGKVFNTMKLNRSYIENENEGQFNWGANSYKQIFVVNQDESNKYGEHRGYRILPHLGASHLTIQNSSVLKNSANWAEHDIMVSKRKDTEPRSAHPYNNQDTENPPVDFSKFFDGESLNQTDLVLWLNLGMHHVPNTGDLPTTVFTTAHSGVQFVPTNYFNIGANVETVNMVRISYQNGVTTDVVTFGAYDGTCDLDYEPAFVDLGEYRGDVVIRKFPYSPDDLYYQTDSISQVNRTA
ncbi:copper amine oxidase [Dactylonectria estremocensis]|uniref:Amine oxidase n=1 Tax=Dactylonectria estremocensis TaxID=1079267 RepID=A0A9P9EUT6_9HYPO|nr:copper amine oxidase [Dactylonectria estremocensis]